MSETSEPQLQLESHEYIASLEHDVAQKAVEAALLRATINSQQQKINRLEAELGKNLAATHTNQEVDGV